MNLVESPRRFFTSIKNNTQEIPLGVKVTMGSAALLGITFGMDVGTTQFLLDNYRGLAEEANPFMSHMIENYGMLGLYGAKLAGGVGVMAAARFLKSQEDHKTGKRILDGYLYANYAMIGTSLITAPVVVNNIVIINQLLGS